MVLLQRDLNPNHKITNIRKSFPSEPEGLMLKNLFFRVFRKNLSICVLVSF